MARKKTPVRIVLKLFVFSAIVSSFSCASLEKVTDTGSEHQGQTFFEAKRGAVSSKTLVAGGVTGIFGISTLERMGKDGRETSSTIVLGDVLIEKDVLKTARSRVHTHFADQTDVFLGEETVFSVERMRFGKANPFRLEADECVFRFDQGLLRIAINQILPNERFILKTPSAVIHTSVPSELYLFQLKGMKDLTVKVVRGTVKIYNVVSGEHASVTERTGAIIRSTGTVSIQGPVSESLLNFLKMRTEI